MSEPMKGMEKIQPALAPEDWAKRKVPDEYAVIREPLWDGEADSEVFADGHFTGQDRHALAALALHGQPFGFTRNDVEALRAILPAPGETWHDAYGRREELASLADRIEALLPPDSHA